MAENDSASNPLLNPVLGRSRSAKTSQASGRGDREDHEAGLDD